MINFTKRYVNTVSLIISLIIFCSLNSYFNSYKNFYSENIYISNQLESQMHKSKVIKSENNTKLNSINTVNPISKEKPKKETGIKKTINWQIEIPKINLKAEVSEGTSKAVMDEYVGHFEETSKDTGNVGLAAHNRGYKVNYFQNLKQLREGDEVFYKYNGKQRKYIVKKIKIIKDTDWTLLENTKENKVTLITCVENQPEYRRCIQAIESSK